MTSPLPSRQSALGRRWRILQERDGIARVVWESPLDDEQYARHLAEQYDAVAPPGLETRLEFQDQPEPPPWENVEFDRFSLMDVELGDDDRV